MTKTISVSYDLRAPGRSYETLYAAIKRTGSAWARLLESLWVVVTNKTSAQVRESLSAHVDQNDQLLVAEFGPVWASMNLGKDVNDWLRTHVG